MEKHNYQSQLTELTVKLCGMVAEKLSYASINLDRNERRRINDMIENDLPTVVTNSIAKSPSLNTADGVKYMETHLDEWSNDWTKKFLGG